MLSSQIRKYKNLCGMIRRIERYFVLCSSNLEPEVVKGMRYLYKKKREFKIKLKKGVLSNEL